MKTKEEIEKLVNDHWDYVAKVMSLHMEEGAIIDKCGFHYKAAFAHGYKHAIEDKNK